MEQIKSVIKHKTHTSYQSYNLFICNVTVEFNSGHCYKTALQKSGCKGLI